ncbi:hypothetical protein PINS_up017099 [Pythium insidiosum]|nr:hypothetical protein PINS_up017099 [Pythium insidiosum]
MNNVVDLSLRLPPNSTPSLREFRLMDNAFATLPAVLYERQYAKLDNLSITITPEPSKHVLPLSGEHYANAKANLAAFTSAANNTASFSHGNETSLAKHHLLHLVRRQ